MRYVDDTLLLIKPQDINSVLLKLNSFHPDLQFTNGIFVDSNDVHFLDLKIPNNEITIYRKTTHTGLFVRYDSCEPWYKKTAWIRSLVTRAKKLCSTPKLLATEIKNIKLFMSWNDYTRYITNKLINKFIQGKNKIPVISDPVKIFINVPFIGKQSQYIVNKTVQKLKALISDKNVKFIVMYKSRQISSFVTYKDYVPNEVRSFNRL